MAIVSSSVSSGRWPAAFSLGVLAVLVATRSARGQIPPQPEAPADSPAPAAPLAPDEPPRAITPTTIETPKDAPPFTEPIVVQVRIVVGADGLVKTVDLVSLPQPGFDEPVIEAAKAFRFEPARFAGNAVPVAIAFSHTFVPPPKEVEPPKDAGPPLVSALSGRLVEKGTRIPVEGATVAVEIGARHYTVDADARGRFRLPLPTGAGKITVHAAGYLPFVQTERLEAKEEVAVLYYIERESYNPYEIVVMGEERREEISRVTLRGAEIKQVPGTFGDPFRVVQALPGVASVASLLPFPVVRGASPGSTGLLLDGTRVPLLFHWLAGPSVIHPEFIDEVAFYPGNAPVLYGGYTAGIVDGHTRRARPDESLIDIDLSLLQTGALVREPLPWIGATGTVAGRIGYPGVIMSLATEDASLSYWDYQARLDGGNARKGWTVFGFGAEDALSTRPPQEYGEPKPDLEPNFVLRFHRLDLRASWGEGIMDSSYRIVGGLDRTLIGDTDMSAWILEPQMRFRWRLHPKLELVAGLEGSFHATSQSTVATEDDGSGGDDGPNLGGILASYGDPMGGAALSEVLWRPTRDWLVRPGVRMDLLTDSTATTVSADPRVAVRYRATGHADPETPPSVDAEGVWVKGGIGMYHAPPRFFLPLPGLDAMPLKFGLLRSIQTDVGIEIPIGQGITLDVDTYYNHMDPVVFDLATNEERVGPTNSPEVVQTDTPNEDDDDQRAIDRLIAAQSGRSYGIETLLRRQSKTGVYGWIAYTLSLSERKRDGVWVPYDYDRTHLVNLVAGFPLPRNWDLGARLQYQSGKPATTVFGYNAGRIDGYYRMDIRIDKRAVWNKWLLDFYVDITNIAVLPEEVAPGQNLRYVLPTLGFRGRI